MGRTLGPCKAGAIVDLSRGVEDRNGLGLKRITGCPGVRKSIKVGSQVFGLSNWKFGVDISELGKEQEEWHGRSGILGGM